VSSRAIRTGAAQESCDVCGRTLLRGERAEIYIAGGDRRAVCELCTSRALHGGWVREGELPALEERRSGAPRRPSLLARIFGSRDGGGPAGAQRRADASARSARAGGQGAAWVGRGDGARGRRAGQDGHRDEADHEHLDGGDPRPDDGAAPPWTLETGAPSRRRPHAAAAPSRGDGRRGRDGLFGARRAAQAGREPRHVHAVPTSIEHRISSAVELFNASEHTRTVAGVARSLGLPEVSVHPSDIGGSTVWLVVAWELCWYRYEVDLAEEEPAVRLSAQGYELSELGEIERQVNAVADERGRLHLA